MTTIPLSLTGRSKRDVIEMAYEEVGSAGYEFERTPEEVASALRRLNMMMTEWPWNLIGYDQPAMGDGAPTDLTGVADNAIPTMALELAARLCGTNRDLKPQQTRRLEMGKNQLFAAYITPPTARFARGTPRGTGNWPLGYGSYVRDGE